MNVCGEDIFKFYGDRTGHITQNHPIFKQRSLSFACRSAHSGFTPSLEFIKPSAPQCSIGDIFIRYRYALESFFKRPRIVASNERSNDILSTRLYISISYAVS